MTVDFSCEKCEASFEIDLGDLIEGSEHIKCPNCSTKATGSMGEDFSNALGELCKQMAAMRKKFGVSLALESDDLPPPYDLEEEEEEGEEKGEDEDLLDEVDEDEDEELEDDEEESY